jgi:hypothetical protein
LYGHDVEQFRPVLRGDHLAGPKPIVLMEPLFIRSQDRHSSDTRLRIKYDLRVIS